MLRRALRLIGSPPALALTGAAILAALVAGGLYLATVKRVERLERPSEAEIVERLTESLRACSRGKPATPTKRGRRAARECRRELLESLVRGARELTPAERRRLRRSSRARGRELRRRARARGARARTRASAAPSSPSSSTRPDRPTAHARPPRRRAQRPARSGGGDSATPAPPSSPPPSSKPPPAASITIPILPARVCAELIELNAPCKR